AGRGRDRPGDPAEPPRDGARFRGTVDATVQSVHAAVVELADRPEGEEALRPVHELTHTMSTTAATKTLNDPEFKARLQDLRRTDNLTNWYYIARTYLYLFLVIGGAVWFFESRADWGISWWWNVPVAVTAVFLVGAGQHQLSGLTHEGSHYIL